MVKCHEIFESIPDNCISVKLLPISEFSLGEIFLTFFILYSTLLHLPPLRFHCADGCWDRTQDRSNYSALAVRHALTTRLDRIRILGRNWDKSFPPCYSQSPLLTDFTPPPPLKKIGLKLVCNVNILDGSLKSENS